LQECVRAEEFLRFFRYLLFCRGSHGVPLDRGVTGQYVM
jgi:hypothetical protein